jgi:hypothetical protein
MPSYCMCCVVRVFWLPCNFSNFSNRRLSLVMSHTFHIPSLLQSIVSVAGGQLHAYFWTKNTAYCLTGVQKVCRFIPTLLGGVSVAQQRCTVFCLIYRVAASTLEELVHLLLPVLPQLWRCELQGMGYSGSVFDSSIRAFVHAQQEHSSHAAWRCLCKCAMTGCQGQWLAAWCRPWSLCSLQS